MSNTEKFIWWVIGGGLIFIAFVIGLFVACRFYVGHPNDTPAFVAGVIGLLTLYAIIAQAVIYKKQSDLMREGLDKTQNLIRQNDAIVSAAQRQALAAEKTLKQTREHFELGERPVIGVEKIKLWHHEEEVGRITAMIRNYGKTPAVNVDMLLTPNFYNASDIANNACPEPHEGVAAADELESCGILPPGVPTELLGAVLPYDPPIRMLKDGEAYVMVWIRIKYKSLYGRVFETEYYARFNAQTGAVVCGNEHNRAT